jgi:putative transposase
VRERGSSLPLKPLLQALNFSRATFYRHAAVEPGEAAETDTIVSEEASEQNETEEPGVQIADTACSDEPAPNPLDAPSRCRVPGRALSPEERRQVWDHLYGERYRDCTPTEVYASLLEQGEYLCSRRTMYRLLAQHGANAPRTRCRRHTQYERPELLATGPNKLWSWDITKLKAATTWSYFHLYVILDVFSRYVVGYMVAHRESKELAKQFIDETLARHSILPGTLTIHADRGAAMISKPVALLLSDLGVAKTHSRPHVSNDNPYSESQFKTLKYRPDFPERFGSIEQARQVCTELFDWYNNRHYHGGIALLTPHAVHHGQAERIIAERQQALDAAYIKRPERFVNQAPRHPMLPEAVWINPPLQAAEEDRPQLIHIVGQPG